MILGLDKPNDVDTQKLIVEVCDEIKELLLAKNKLYGDSAINPKRIFSKADVLEQIYVRIDDKLSRISTSGHSGGSGVTHEDTLMDLMGYLVLAKVAIKKQSTNVPKVNG
jgi:hypothetical protein